MYIHVLVLKVVQVAAKILGVPLDSIKVKPTDTLIGPNDMTTGGSATSELCCLVRTQTSYTLVITLLQGTLRVCNELNERIAPIRAANPNASWKELVMACYSQGVNLSAENL